METLPPLNPDEQTLVRKDDYWVGGFHAMASPCELLMEVDDGIHANTLLSLVRKEAQRIETKFSRYRQDNIIHQINHSDGKPVDVDDETARLLDYAAQCYVLSNGSFDVTSGILRQVWRFDGTDHIPSKSAVEALLPHIGWDKIQWNNPVISVPAGMEIDLGGIGKEYAVDTSMQILRQHTDRSCLVNFGGDLCVTGPRANGKGWVVGVSGGAPMDVHDGRAYLGKEVPATFLLSRGGIATSGDAYRFLLKDGVRYSHILDPTTGWPVSGGPHSVTVAAASCTEAGIMATLAMLQGAEAEVFLQSQGVTYWIC